MLFTKLCYGHHINEDIMGSTYSTKGKYFHSEIVQEEGRCVWAD